jgi:hypothetical protein
MALNPHTKPLTTMKDFVEVPGGCYSGSKCSDLPLKRLIQLISLFRHFCQL